MKKLLLPRLALLLLALPFTAQAQEREWIPYKRLIEVVKLDKFYALPAAERDKLKVYAHFTPSNKAIAPSSMKLVVAHSEGRTPLPIDEQGRALVVPNQKWLSEDAKIYTSMPAGEKAAIGFFIAAVMPEGQEWRYSTLMSSVPQTNAVIGKVAGMMRMFVPSMKQVILKFNKPAQLTIQSKGGEKRLATDAKHQIHLKLDDGLLAENPLLVLSERPFEAEVDE